jgi:hypothetical protein
MESATTCSKEILGRNSYITTEHSTAKKAKLLIYLILAHKGKNGENRKQSLLPAMEQLSNSLRTSQNMHSQQLFNFASVTLIHKTIYIYVHDMNVCVGRPVCLCIHISSI